MNKVVERPEPTRELSYGAQDSQSNQMPDDVAVLLDEIFNALWSRQAAVMVGAGFSRNADPISETVPPFPLSCDLAHTFHQEVRKISEGTNTPEREETHDLTTEAELLEAHVGHDRLDEVIMLAIPDNQYTPSKLHVELVSLPWSEIFTMNYDTLIEKAAILSGQRYLVIRKQEDLFKGAGPRIVKLHGSIPDIRPFVITKNDYHKYHDSNELFVNKVRTTLVENSICLLGFSGEDQNFQAWMQWIIKRQGVDNERKVYLISILSHEDEIIARNRGLVPVNLGRCPDVGQDQSRAAALFLNRMKSGFMPASCIWLSTSESNTRNTSSDCIVLTTLWQEERLSYPGWAIAPSKKRQLIKREIDWMLDWKAISENFNGLTESLQIDFLFELNWRLERALYPIPNQLSSFYNDITQRFLSQQDTEQIDRVRTNPATEKTDFKLFQLLLAVLRSNREKGKDDSWKGLYLGISMQTHMLDEDQLASLRYETCLKALFDGHLDSLSERIQEWPSNPAMPLWEARRSGLIAEYGEIDLAMKALQDSLDYLDGQIHNCRKDPDKIKLLSEKDCVQHLLWNVRHSHNSQGGADSTIDSDDVAWVERSHSESNHPFSVLKEFEKGLAVPSRLNEYVETKKLFDIGVKQTCHHIHCQDEPVETAFSFLRYCEEMGLPFALPNIDIVKESGKLAAEKIYVSHCVWALAIWLRVGDPDVGDIGFSREALSKITQAAADSMSVRLINTFCSALALEGSQSGMPLGTGSRFIRTIPEFLSRLCTRNSRSVRDLEYDVLTKIYEAKISIRSSSIRNFVERLLASSSDMEQIRHLANLAMLPIPNDSDRRHFYPDPLMYVHDNVLTQGAPSRSALSDAEIAKLADGMNSKNQHERNSACVRTYALNLMGLIDEKQFEIIGRALWSLVDESGLPRGTGLRLWNILTLPTPHGISASEVFKTYILSWSPGSVGNSAGMSVSFSGETVGFTNGDISWSSNLIRASKNETGLHIDWSQEEILDILSIIEEWWKLTRSLIDKFKGIETTSDIVDELRLRGHSLMLVLCHFLIPACHKRKMADARTRYLSLIDEIEPCHPIGFALMCDAVFSSEQIERAISLIQINMISTDRRLFKDAFDTVWKAIVESKNVLAYANAALLADWVGQQIRWRRLASLDLALQTMQGVLTNNSELISEELMKNVIDGLSQLAEETSLSSSSPLGDGFDCLLIRKYAAKLSYALYKHHVENGLAIPEALLKWKTVCQDTMEFVEIRDQWLQPD